MTDQDSSQAARPVGAASSSGTYLRWITTVVLAVAAVFLFVLLVFQVVRPEKYHIASGDQRAMDAASQAMVNLTTFGQKTYEADFANALAALSGKARQDLQAEHDDLINTMTQAKVDLRGEVAATALESSGSASVQVLVYVNAFRILANGSKQAQNSQAMELTMKQSSGKWLVDDIQVLGITA